MSYVKLDSFIDYSYIPSISHSSMSNIISYISIHNLTHLIFIVPTIFKHTFGVLTLELHNLRSIPWKEINHVPM